MKEVLLQAVQLSVFSCTEQMADQRWNCSLGASRVRILHKGTGCVMFCLTYRQQYREPGSCTRERLLS